MLVRRHINDGRRAFSTRCAAERGGAKPAKVQAGPYAAVPHHIEAVTTLGSAKGCPLVEA